MILYSIISRYSDSWDVFLCFRLMRILSPLDFHIDYSYSYYRSKIPFLNTYIRRLSFTKSIGNNTQDTIYKVIHRKKTILLHRLIFQKHLYSTSWRRVWRYTVLPEFCILSSRKVKEVWVCKKRTPLNGHTTAGISEVGAPGTPPTVWGLRAQIPMVVPSCRT